jgi:TIP41-like family
MRLVVYMLTVPVFTPSPLLQIISHYPLPHRDRASNRPDVVTIEPTFDWTYSSRYRGTDDDSSVKPRESSERTLDLALLKVRRCVLYRTIPLSFVCFVSPFFLLLLFSFLPVLILAVLCLFPLQLLQRPDKILWNTQMMLYEDELHDHGMSQMEVKVVCTIFYVAL